ncbi:conjugal transfer protein TraH [Vibrio parahaemolyticus]|nr:conjugal transfer protein TraH [Vibrio parahaemolyticus]
MENFQKKVQALNQHLANSCQLAQGIVNDATSAFDIQHKTKASIKATGLGFMTICSVRYKNKTGKLHYGN